MSASMETGSGDEVEASPTLVVLQHPSGSKVFMVGTAHVSAQAAQEAADTIQRVGPAIVVLELDQERFDKLSKAAEESGPFGLRRLQEKSTLQLVKMTFTGEVLPYFMGLVYSITGAVMGSMPGAEFLAAAEAAKSTGAAVVLADRSQQATMKRLTYFTHHLARRDSRARADMDRMRRAMDAQRAQQAAGASGDIDSESAMPDLLRGPEEGRPTATEEQVAAEVAGDRDPWGLGPEAGTEAGMRRRLLAMMREGGCEGPEEVLEAAKRMLQAGLTPKGRIAPVDVLRVRACGQRVVESFRRRAMAGDDSWMQRLDAEAAGAAKGAAGMDRDFRALRQVIVRERDLILARRLWEAGLDAGGQPVVGVVGAGHVSGIQRLWGEAGSEEAAARAAEYMQVPSSERGSPLLTTLVTGGVLGMIAYRKPRAAAYFAGAVTLATAPYLGFMIMSMRRFTAFADKLAAVSEQMAAAGGEDAMGWPSEGPTDWQ